jgi:hypothetical protein
MIQGELGKFIKFACNQDRIPMVGDREWQHVPPYPMKIAPADRKLMITFSPLFKCSDLKAPLSPLFLAVYCVSALIYGIHIFVWPIKLRKISLTKNCNLA